MKIQDWIGMLITTYNGYLVIEIHSSFLPRATLHRWAWAPPSRSQGHLLCWSASEGCPHSRTTQTSPSHYRCPHRKLHLRGQMSGTQRLTWYCRIKYSRVVLNPKMGIFLNSLCDWPQAWEAFVMEAVVVWLLRWPTYLLISVRLTVVWISGLQMSLFWPRKRIAWPDTAF